MDHPIRAFLVLVFAVATVGATLMMPWGELNMEHSKEAMPHTLKLFYVDEMFSGLMSTFSSQKESHKTFLSSKEAEGKHGEYVYGLAMAAALLFASIGIMAIGSADESEKTMIPEKK